MANSFRDPTTALYTLGRHRAIAGDELIRLREINVVERVWRGDHSVWKPSPDEITNRLGWLSIPEDMAGETSALTAFAGDIRREGYNHVVLLGMGGSSLGPELLRQAFGSKPGSPGLTVLDSTVPGWVSDVSDRIDPARTLFIVSSKSGTTIEPNVLYSYFRGLVDRSVGNAGAGKNFVAVTDPGAALEKLAARDGFRRVFHGNADVGGRYSILSNFGLVPAALMGIDIDELLERAARMRAFCMGADIADNPGGALGAAIGRLALEGRDKLTLLASPSITGFGLWVEQLVAESLGKECRGVVPVAGEAALGPDAYGDDRLFVQVRLEGDDNALIDEAVEDLSRSERPFIRLELGDRLDLGGEVFKWEVAVAVAGAVLGVNPLDQPDVQAAKDMTSSVLAEFESSGSLPDAPETMPVPDLLSEIRPGDYVAIMAYARQTPELDAAVDGLRRALMTRFQVATTMGYGPRFLHSTGQLHKGGPPSGVFLQLVEDSGADIEIPGQPYSFGVLASAQALGDLRALQAQGRRASGLDTSGGCVSAVEALTGSLTAGS